MNWYGHEIQVRFIRSCVQNIFASDRKHESLFDRSMLESPPPF